jgi:hypothetical protein
LFGASSSSGSDDSGGPPIPPIDAPPTDSGDDYDEDRLRFSRASAQAWASYLPDDDTIDNARRVLLELMHAGLKNVPEHLRDPYVQAARDAMRKVMSSDNSAVVVRTRYLGQILEAGHFMSSTKWAHRLACSTRQCARCWKQRGLASQVPTTPHPSTVLSSSMAYRPTAQIGTATPRCT